MRNADRPFVQSVGGVLRLFHNRNDGEPEYVPTGNEIKRVTAAYTLADGDHGLTLNVDAGSDVNITVPAGLAPDFVVNIRQAGAGKAVIVTSGTTVNSASTEYKSGGTFTWMSLLGVGQDVFDLVGSTSA
jgi:hypothetical protein